MPWSSFPERRLVLLTRKSSVGPLLRRSRRFWERVLCRLERNCCYFFATCAVRRLSAPARVALRHAVDLGATPEEIEELLIACFTSRGALAYFEARSIVQEVLPDASENEPVVDP